jgi:putative endonuclease
MGTFFSVYILECNDGTLYTGITSDLERRVHEHNGGKAARYTCGRRPVNLVYAETVATRSDALKREARIKKLSRAQKLLLVHGKHELLLEKAESSLRGV